MGTAGKLSIEENLSLALLRGKPRGFKIALNRERRRFFRTRLASLGLGLEDRLGAPAHTLSGGQRQALALIMATISNPAILLLDEHTATLDPKTARTVLSITDEIITREKMTAVMVTHNMEVALRYGNRLIMMHRGRVILDIAEEQKKGLSVTSLLGAFERAAGEEFTDDSVLLSSEL
jgi:putative ABC transport system ATP-binding protein